MGLDSVSIVLVYSRFFFFLGTVWMYQYSLGFEVSFLLDISVLMNLVLPNQKNAI